jgi:serine/threonine protein phosphatase PrpC
MYSRAPVGADLAGTAVSPFLFSLDPNQRETPTVPALDQQTSRPPRQDIDVFGITHRGKVRETNNDHYLLCSLRKHIEIHSTSLPAPERLPHEGEWLAYLGLVADGVGGSKAGGQASRLATEALYDYVAHSLRCYYTADPQHETGFVANLHKAVMEAHAHVRQAAEESSESEGMATTLTMALSVWPRAYIVQVGDSRAYRLRNGELERITRDQTVAQALHDAGAITRSEADRSPMKHVLTSALGGGESSPADPVTSLLDLETDDLLLLCSDGLTGHLKDDEIRAILEQGGSAEQLCRTLLEEALDRGGHDNVTVLIGKTRERD